MDRTLTTNSYISWQLSVCLLPIIQVSILTMLLVAVIGHVWFRDPWHCVDVKSQPSPLYQLRHLPCFLSFRADPNQRLLSKGLVQIHGSVLYCLHKVTILKINEFTSCLSSWTEKPMITQMTHKYESHTDEKMKTRKKAVSKMTRHNYQYASFGLKNGLLLLLMCLQLQSV